MDINKIVEELPAKADPRPCPRCRHRQDVHEPHPGGVRFCRLCEWVGAAWPCSSRTLGMQRRLDSLTFDLEL